MFSDTEAIRRVSSRLIHPLPRGIGMLSIFRRLARSESGVTAIEYTLIAALSSVAAIVAMGNVGTKVIGVMSNVANAMK